ncbi:hypothetical protein [Corynebacterium sphenisci]|uniref:hypothetical protein n=1 Tax=Corynebacterium sphenisci TaxID=191493 RepID=UPI0026DEC68C|nr:hypothetical protein [Corynebacterium sphenisci]MDO5731198.1 hypothetical protein [Corynebacterium sphenisci]
MAAGIACAASFYADYSWRVRTITHRGPNTADLEAERAGEGTPEAGARYGE